MTEERLRHAYAAFRSTGQLCADARRGTDGLHDGLRRDDPESRRRLTMGTSRQRPDLGRGVWRSLSSYAAFPAAGPDTLSEFDDNLIADQLATQVPAT